MNVPDDFLAKLEALTAEAHARGLLAVQGVLSCLCGAVLGGQEREMLAELKDFSERSVRDLAARLRQN